MHSKISALIDTYTHIRGDTHMHSCTCTFPYMHRHMPSQRCQKPQAKIGVETIPLMIAKDDMVIFTASPHCITDHFDGELQVLKKQDTIKL